MVSSTAGATLRGLAIWMVTGAALVAFSPDAHAQSCGRLIAGFSEAFTGNCPSSPPQLRFRADIQCLDSCGRVLFTNTSMEEAVAEGDCSGPCHPYYIVRNQVQGLTWRTTARGQKISGTILPECINRSTIVERFYTCPCIECDSGDGGGGGSPDPRDDDTGYQDPLIISLNDTEYVLSSVEEGVKFDLDGDGEGQLTAWTVAGTDDAFLALDRDGNGSIDHGRELFGDATPQLPSNEPNGFRALAVFDSPANGGNDDDQIDARDFIFEHLRLWVDSDHDARSTPQELLTLPEAGIIAIELGYEKSSSVDAYGNEFRYSSFVRRSEAVPVRCWNVFLINSTP